MSALAKVREMGLSVTADRGRLAVEPRLLITSAARDLIKSAKAEIMADLKAEADLLDLVEHVAAFYQCGPEELTVVRRVALADPAAARECFQATARFDGIDLSEPMRLAPEQGRDRLAPAKGPRR
ncbi:MAG TPA: hypothetical protein VH040_11085 [Usitatibacter sp.]|jgi:hypothetical protein|nr:hypothetical protein [Usitatibacter sp.]